MKTILLASALLAATGGFAAAQSTLPLDQQPGATCKDTLNAGGDPTLPCPAVPSPNIDRGTTSSVPNAAPPADPMPPLVVPNDPLANGNENGAGATPFGNPSISKPSGSVSNPSVSAPAIR